MPSQLTSSCDHDHSSAADPPDASRDRPDAVRIDHVSFSYHPPQASARVAAAQEALHDVSLRVEQGMNLGIIGPNGAGKTTLLRIMLGLLEGYSGRVSIMGLPPRQACLRGDIIGYVPQRPQVEWRFPLTARQVVRLGLVGKTGLFRRYQPDDLQYVEQMMARVGVADIAGRPIGELSGGQQQRLFIARALVARPRILVLDEPMAAIDVAGQREIGSLIRDLHRSLKVTVIVVSHDVEALAAGCTRVACLRNTIHYHDAPEGLTPQVLRAVFQHGMDAVFGEQDQVTSAARTSQTG